MDTFLSENPELSPSKLLQSKIIEIHEQKKMVYEKVRTLNRKIENMSKMLSEKCEECENLENELVQKNENS